MMTKERLDGSDFGCYLISRIKIQIDPMDHGCQTEVADVDICYLHIHKL